jgi:D-3-phosphoglycerate dehydrogenase
LVNTARGEIVPFSSLREALQSGKLRGACLDVLEQEKLDRLTPAQAADFEWLAQQPNVIFSPHVAGWTYESYVRINRVLVDKLVQLMA